MDLLTVHAALLQGAVILEKAGISVPRLTAEVLLCHALQCERPYLYAHADDKLTELAWIHYGRYLNDRLKGMPTQYITHQQEFFGRPFYVNDSVLIPRPETEHLVEAAAKHLQQNPGARTIDVGTGSGAIAVTIALEMKRNILASDISLPAIQVARRNALKHKAAVQFFAADLVEAVASSGIDLLISNPPYVPGADAANMQSEVRDWEPHLALFADESGLEIYRRLIASATTALKPGGRLLMELGFRSLESVREMLAGQWTDLEVSSDLAGLPRVIGASLRS